MSYWIAVAIFLLLTFGCAGEPTLSGLLPIETCAGVYRHYFESNTDSSTHSCDLNEASQFHEVKNAIYYMNSALNSIRTNINVTIVSYASDDILEYSKYSFFLLEQYALIHDYNIRLLSTSDLMLLNSNNIEFEVGNSNSKPANGNSYDKNDIRWNKVKIMLDLINNFESINTNIEKDMYFVWIDADAIVMDFNLGLEGIIYRDEHRRNIYISEDIDIRNGIANTGVMIIKSCPWSVEFLSRWWGDYNHEDGMDQFAFTHLYDTFNSELKHASVENGRTELIEHYISILPIEALNSRIPARKYQVDSDAVLHLAGELNSYRASVFALATEQYCAVLCSNISYTYNARGLESDASGAIEPSSVINRTNTTRMIHITQAMLQSIYAAQFISDPVPGFENKNGSNSNSVPNSPRSRLMENILDDVVAFHRSFYWELSLTADQIKNFNQYMSGMRSQLRDLMQIDRSNEFGEGAATILDTNTNALYVAANAYTDRMAALILLTLYDMSRQYVHIVDTFVRKTDYIPGSMHGERYIMGSRGNAMNMVVQLKQLKVDLCFDIMTIPSSDETITSSDPSTVEYSFSIDGITSSSHDGSNGSYQLPVSLSIECVHMLLNDVAQDIDDLMEIFQSKNQAQLAVLYYYKFKHNEFLTLAYKKSSFLLKYTSLDITPELKRECERNYEQRYIYVLNRTCSLWHKLHSEYSYYGTGNALAPIQAYSVGVLLMQELGQYLCSKHGTDVSSNRLQLGLYWLRYALGLLEKMHSNRLFGKYADINVERNDADSVSSTIGLSNQSYMQYLKRLYHEIFVLNNDCQEQIVALKQRKESITSSYIVTDFITPTQTKHSRKATTTRWRRKKQDQSSKKKM